MLTSVKTIQTSQDSLILLYYNIENLKEKYIFAHIYPWKTAEPCDSYIINYSVNILEVHKAHSFC